MAMRLKRLSPRLRLVLIGMLAASVLVVVVSRTSQSFGRAARRKPSIERLHAYLLAGVGSEVRFASAGARAEDVRASLDSVAEFIRYRSGLELNGEVKDRLARMEERVRNAKGRRIPVDELGDLFTTVLVERLHNCTDAEIEQVADDLTNINRPPLKYDKATGKAIRIEKAKEAQAAAASPIEGDGSDGSGKADAFERIVMRFNGQGQMTREAFILQAQNLRERFQSPLQQVMMVTLARQMVTRLVRNRVETLSAALPEQWGGAQEEGLTPMQAFLIAYSAVSDDPLQFSREGLNNLRAQLEQTWKAATNEAISYDGKAAFGTGGYYFSSPLDLAFNLETTGRLLKLLDERSAK